jgi:MraZ protein
VGKTFVAAVLYGQFRLSIDAKNRLLIPASIRNDLDPLRDGKAFFVVTGDNGKLWLYTERAYDAMAEHAPRELAPSDEQLEFDHLHYGLAEKLEWDQQGRVLLPADEMEETGTGRDVVLFGSRDHLEIWNRTDFEEHRKSLRARRKEISARGRQKRSEQNGKSEHFGKSDQGEKTDQGT